MYNKKAVEKSSHTVESGDTLSEIVADYNEQNGTSYTYQEIAEQNGIENPDMIHPGDVIEFGNNAEKSDITDAGQNQESPKTEGNGNEENSSFNDDFWGNTDSSDDSGNEGNFGGITAKDEQDVKSGNDTIVPDYGLPMTEIEIAIKAHPDNYGNESSHKPDFSETQINWKQVGSGAWDLVSGAGGIAISFCGSSNPITAAGSCLLFQESLTTFCYGMAEIWEGFQGRSLPSSTDLLIEKWTFGLAETEFDK